MNQQYPLVRILARSTSPQRDVQCNYCYIAWQVFRCQASLDELGIRAEDELSRDSLIVLYADCTGCAGTNKTLVLQSKLDALGFTRVTRLQGGLDGWKQAGFEVVKD